MSKQKVNVPTICNRKLHRMTLITEKNLGKVMGDLNRFFRKPTKVLRGYTKKIIGTKSVTLYGDTFQQNIYAEEETPNWVAFQGNCHIHWRWRAYLEGKEPYLCPEEIKRLPRLAISSPFEENCAPIEIGARYKIFGNHLVIIEPYNKFIHANPYCSTMWLRCREWIQVEENPEESRKIQESGLYDAITGMQCYAYEDLEYSISDRDNIFMIEDAIRDLAENIYARIPAILNRVGEVVTETFSMNDKEVKLEVDVDKWLSHGNSVEDAWNLSIEGEKTQNIITIARVAFRDLILAWQKDDEDDGAPDDDSDYDYWPDDGLTWDDL